MEYAVVAAAASVGVVVIAMFRKAACRLPKLLGCFVDCRDSKVVVNSRLSDLVDRLVNVRSNFQEVSVGDTSKLVVGKVRTEARIRQNEQCHLVDAVVGSLLVRILAFVENSASVHMNPRVE